MVLTALQERELDQERRQLQEDWVREIAAVVLAQDTDINAFLSYYFATYSALEYKKHTNSMVQTIALDWEGD